VNAVTTAELHQFMLARVKSKKYTLRNLSTCDVPAGAICYVLFDSDKDDRSLLTVIQHDATPMISTQYEYIYVTPTLDVEDFTDDEIYVIATDPFIYMLPKLETVMNDLEPNRTFERINPTPFLR
jgi:hypothetical protein